MTLAKEIRRRLVDTMRSLVGVPYIWGSKDPRVGLDCSGAVSVCLERVGIVPGGWRLTHTAEGIRDWAIPVPLVEAEPGDLVFYGSPMRISHVMMLLDEITVIGSAGGGPRCTMPEIAESIGAGVQLKPLGYRRDLVELRRAPLPAGLLAG